MATGRKPVLTVVMPVYNGKKFLKRSIGSILSQTLRDFEFLIINDGSTDGSDLLLQACARRDRRIRILRNPRNLGLVESLNRGLKEARAPLIARFDCDDFSRPERLEKQLKYLLQHPDCAVLGTQVRWVDPQGKETMRSHFPAEDREIREAFFSYKCVLQHTTTLFRKIGGLAYRDATYPAEDYDFFLRLLEKGKGHVLNEFLVDMTLNPQGISAGNRIQQVLAVREVRKLLVQRMAKGRELDPPRSFRSRGSLRFRIINRLFLGKWRTRNRPVNYLFLSLICLLSPAYFLHNYFSKRFTRHFHPEEYERFLALPGLPAFGGNRAGLEGKVLSKKAF